MRVWLLALVAVLVAAVLAATHWSGDDDQAAGTARPPTELAVATRLGHNRALTRHEIAHIARTTPRPPGALRTRRVPDPYLKVMHGDSGALDPALVRTSFWSVPMGYVQLVRWYDDNTPALISSTGWPHPHRHGATWWRFKQPSQVWIEPGVNIGYARIDATHTALRVDVTGQSRIDRTSEAFVPVNRVTSVEVARTDYDENASGPSVTDPARVRALADAFDRLYGSEDHLSHTGGCGSPFGDSHVYSATFHWPGHSLSALANFCRDDRRLVLDGHQLHSRLADDARFPVLLQQAYEDAA